MPREPLWEPKELPFGLLAYGPAADPGYEDGELVITTGPGQDRFVHPGREPKVPAADAPRLLGTPPEGDFQLIARVTPRLRSAGDAGALCLEVADDQWAKLCLELSPARYTVVSVVTRGRSDDANSYEVPGDHVWLRITRTGRAFAFHASDDGERWTFVRLFTLGTEREAAVASVGFMAQCPSPDADGCTAVFDRIVFRPWAPGDLRDGS
ncbi:DUF1349 domain-containing protein [Streptomyces sp. H39-S7]|uniref:DUF1349 domain-containing protein n=1 Tax=Streptomyces sp. H39-S7 TaxID=3004357 RepID=UPI0022AFB966|nr:DUF1349 domain-containing protein [Streptomyces sp. H39-S7]MCZ4121135.1 DUF1349 domain-containing protein [Streptomyces sp. H39-S7]